MSERVRVQKFCEGPSLTRQEFKAECDLAMIVKRFAKTPEGAVALQNFQQSIGGRYDDVTVIPDYRTARDAVIAAEAKFMALPAIVRKRFSNDPAEFLDFCNDPKNLGELRSMGLAKPEPVVETALPVETVA